MGEAKACLKMLLSHKRKSDFHTTDYREDLLLNPPETHAIMTTEALLRYALDAKGQAMSNQRSMS